LLNGAPNKLPEVSQELLRYGWMKLPQQARHAHGKGDPIEGILGLPPHQCPEIVVVDQLKENKNKIKYY